MLAIILFPIILYLPGFVAYRVFWHGRRWLWQGSPTEAAFVQFLIGGVYAGLTGLMLAQLGYFSLLTLLAATLLPSLIVMIMHRNRFTLPKLSTLQLKTQNSKLKTLIEPVAVAALLLVAIFLFARPGELIRGAADAGIYVNSGANIAQHGSIFIKDPLIRNMTDEEIRQYFVGLSPDRYTLTRQRASGFYIYDKKAMLVIPQHYTLFSVWIAIFYVVTGGIGGALYATPYLMLLGLMAVYFAGKRMFGAVPAFLGAVLLAVNTTEVWFARYSVAEAGTQFLGFAAFYCFAVFVSTQRRLDSVTANKGRTPSPPAPPPITGEGRSDTSGIEISEQNAAARGFAVLAAVALGEICFVRPDFIFYLVPVPLYLGWLLLTRRWRANHRWLFVTLLAMLLLAVVHIFFFTYPYTFDLFHNTLIDQRRLWQRNFSLLYGGVAVLLVAWLLLAARPRWLRLAARLVAQYWPIARTVLLALLALGAGAYMVNVYLIKPHIITLSNITHPSELTAYIGAPVPFDAAKSPSENNQAIYNMVKVGWYFSPLGIALATLGLMMALWRRWMLKTAFFFLMLAISLFVFVGETYSDPHYIYTMRRYIPIITPAFSLLIGYFCWTAFSWGRELARRRGWRLSVGFAAMLGVVALYVAELAFFVYTLRPILNHVEDAGAIAQISSLAEKLPANSVTLMSADRDTPYVVLTPLRFIYNRDVLSLSQNIVLSKDTPPVSKQVMDNSAIIKGSVDGWMKQNRPVYVMLGANGGKLNLPGYDLKPLDEWKYTVPEFEQLYYQKPFNVSESSLQYGLYQVLPHTITPTLSSPLTLDIGGNFDYPNTVSGWYDKETDSNGVSYRWTGSDAIIRVPAPATTTQAITVTLRLSAGPPQRCSSDTQRTTPAQFGLYDERGTPVILGKLPVACQPATSDGKPQPGSFSEVRGALQVAPPPTDGWLYLHLHADTWQPAADTPGADARRLGVQLDEIKIEK